MNQKGFTLIEVLIAIGLLTIIMASVFITQGSSQASSVRNRNILIATNLARNLINEQEFKYEGVPFDKLPEKDSGKFAEPYQDIEWEVTFTEIDFAVLTQLIQQKAQAENPEESGANTATMLKMFEEYLKKSVRKMTIQLRWPENGGTSTQDFTQLLVNYDAEFTSSI